MRRRIRPHRQVGRAQKGSTANLRTATSDFRGFDSSGILILRGGILLSIGNFPEILSQQILVRRDKLRREIGHIFTRSHQRKCGLFMGGH